MSSRSPFLPSTNLKNRGKNAGNKDLFPSLLLSAAKCQVIHSKNRSFPGKIPWSSHGNSDAQNAKHPRALYAIAWCFAADKGEERKCCFSALLLLFFQRDVGDMLESASFPTQSPPTLPCFNHPYCANSKIVTIPHKSAAVWEFGCISLTVKSLWSKA